MSLIPASLKSIDSRRAMGCQKPGCTRHSSKASGSLHRHHVRHEAMWIGIWAGRRREEPKYRALVLRYKQFRPRDCILLCANHHAEAHAVYDKLITLDKKLKDKPLSRYTWAEAASLMDTLEVACFEWLRKPTPGISSKKYAATKRKRKANARRKRNPASSR